MSSKISIYNEFSQDLETMEVLILLEDGKERKSSIFVVDKDIKPWSLVLAINEALSSLQDAPRSHREAPGCV